MKLLIWLEARRLKNALINLTRSPGRLAVAIIMAIAVFITVFGQAMTLAVPPPPREFAAVATLFGDASQAVSPYQPFLPNILARFGSPAGADVTFFSQLPGPDILTMELTLAISPEFVGNLGAAVGGSSGFIRGGF